MKTILVSAIIAGVIILGSSTYVYSQMYDCLNPPGWMKVPYFGLEKCFQLYLNGNLPDWTQAREDHEKEQTLRIKLVEQFQDKPEVVAFYSKYPDANVSVRDDHVSYFAGNEEDFLVRMNLYFDENYDLDYIDFNCYFDRVPQTEVAEHFILKYLEKYDCKKYGT